MPDSADPYLRSLQQMTDDQLLTEAVRRLRHWTPMSWAEAFEAVNRALAEPAGSFEPPAIRELRARRQGGTHA